MPFSFPVVVVVDAFETVKVAPVTMLQSHPARFLIISPVFMPSLQHQL